VPGCPTVLITGAAGRIGRALIEDLRGVELRLFDRVCIGAPDVPDGGPAFEVIGDITDPDALDRAMGGVSVVVHLAGDRSARASFPSLAHANIDGTYQVFEAARRAGVERVILASSNRVVEGASPLRTPGAAPLHPDDPARPDSLYGVSKVFGEALAAHYSDAFGMATACLRLGSVDLGASPAVEDKPRAWGLWLSRRDLVGIVDAAIRAPLTGHAVVFACSANTRRWWDLEPTRRVLGYAPADDSEQLLHDGHPAAVPPAPPYPLPWGECLAALVPGPGRAFLVALGQSGFLLRTPGAAVAVDPFLTPYPDRLQDPLLDAADLPVDHVLITHTHRDHLDQPALAALLRARPRTRLVGPPTVVRALAAQDLPATPLLPAERLRLGDVEVTAIAVRHRPTTPDAQGYVLATTAATVFHTGDAEHDPCLLDALAHRPDLLLVPVNGRKGNMTAEQAARLAADLAVPVAVPMHHGCLQPTGDLVTRFTAELARLAPATRSAPMDPGAIAHLPLP
jgi:uronate dehydrogenase